MRHQAFVAIGSNVGHRRHWLQHAVDGLKRLSTDYRVSPVYESRAHPISKDNNQSDYLNAVVEIFTRLSPEVLLTSCLDLEQQAGRVRTERNAPRTLDLDILEFDGIICNERGLILPHPRLHLRRFVLQPWYDLAPEHYVGGNYCATVAQLLTGCTDAGLLTACAWSLTG